MNATTTAQALAADAAAAFEVATCADEDDTYTRLQDGSPQWMTDLVHEAHGDMLPDDWRYACIAAACEHIADNGADEDGAHDFADAYVDVYTSNLLEWLSSHGARQGYVDEAVSEYGYPEDRGIDGAIAMGQYLEAQEVYGAVLVYLERSVDA